MKTPGDSERADLEFAELEAMIEMLARSPRLSNLLRYIGEKHRKGDSSRLREHNIAIDVFGRPETFDPSQDAIARVEAHRLRKKLREFYAGEGRDREIQIVIPPGSYAPVFVYRHEEAVANPVNAPGDVSTPVVAVAEIHAAPALPRASAWRGRRLWFSVGLMALAALTTGLALTGRFTHAAASAPVPVSGKPPAEPAGGSAATDKGAVRILAGYSGPPHMDPAGAVWEPDKYFDRGGGWRGSEDFTARTNDTFLFRTVRTGEFSYNIPLSPGVYELHLYFVEPSFGPGLGGGELSRTFDVILNGVKALSGFDIEADTMGPRIADERIFKGIQPAADGKLHIGLEGVSGKPILSAIEILPGLPHQQIPIRFTTQSVVYIDNAGRVWGPDNYFLNGQSSQRKPPVTGSPDPGLFATERYGHFNYAIPVDTTGRYTVNLYFAEYYFGPGMPGGGGTGRRVFNITCNGVMLIEDFDIFREAGSLHGIVKSFHHLKPSPHGKLNLGFEPSANYANVSAIEVIDESR